MDDLLHDPELERLHAERLAAMQREAEKRVQLQRKGHGELQEVFQQACHTAMPARLADLCRAHDLSCSQRCKSSQQRDSRLVVSRNSHAIAQGYHTGQIKA